MIQGLLGKKIGMTQTFEEDGSRVPVTLLEIGPCQVQNISSKEKDGKSTVQLGFEETKESRIKKPQRVENKNKKLTPKKFVREVPYVDEIDIKIGDELTNKVIQKGDYLDVTGISKGKGFQGGMKRHNWSGGRATHGSMSHRVPGSIGASSYPSRVFKGQNMPGNMGNERVTVQNLEVMEVDIEKNTVAVKGAVPGPNGAYLMVRYALKKALAPRVKEADEETEENDSKEEGKE